MMAKKKQEEPVESSGDDVDRSDSVRHADDSARQQAIAKMKAAQADQATSEKQEEFQTEADSDEEREVKSSDLDPKAKKALTELLGSSNDKEKSGELGQVKVYSPFRIYYDSPASSVSAVNGTGPFDVLPGHKNFLTLLSQGDIVVRSVTGKEETISIDRGVMHVHGDNVKVFLDV